MDLVYVASPYTALACDDELARNAIAIKIAIDECQKITNLSKEFVVVSPILLFNGVLDETFERGRIIDSCLELIKCCDYIYFSTHKDAKNSAGMKLEREFAKKRGLTELILDENCFKFKKLVEPKNKACDSENEKLAQSLEVSDEPKSQN